MPSFKEGLVSIKKYGKTNHVLSMWGAEAFGGILKTRAQFGTLFLMCSSVTAGGHVMLLHASASIGVVYISCLHDHMLAYFLQVLDLSAKSLIFSTAVEWLKPGTRWSQSLNRESYHVSTLCRLSGKTSRGYVFGHRSLCDEHRWLGGAALRVGHLGPRAQRGGECIQRRQRGTWGDWFFWNLYLRVNATVSVSLILSQSIQWYNCGDTVNQCKSMHMLNQAKLLMGIGNSNGGDISWQFMTYTTDNWFRSAKIGRWFQPRSFFLDSSGYEFKPGFPR